MNCDQITQRLAEGEPLDAAAQAHLETCAGCRAMLDGLNQAAAAPDPALLARINAQLSGGLTTVRPLPSNAVLLCIAVAATLLIAVAGAWMSGFYALKALNATQKTLYYAAVLLLTVLFARALVEQMIPGMKRVLSAAALAALAFTGLTILLFALFEERTFDHFVHRGVPCLRLGCISALVSGLIGWRFFRRGYCSSPLEAGILYGLFAGLAGVAVLALHCPIQNFPHFLAWHLSAMALAAFAGVGLGKLIQNTD